MPEAVQGLRSDSALQGWDGPLNLRDIFVAIPKYSVSLVERYQELMRGPSPLSPGEREAIYAYLSRRNDCHFCATSHGACAQALGIDKAVFGMQPERIDTMPLRPAIRAAMHFVVALNLPGIPRQGVERARGSLRALQGDMLRDAVLVAALTAFINRVIDGLGASAPDDLHMKNGAALAEHGYLPVAEAVRQGLTAAGRGGVGMPMPTGASPFPGFGNKGALLHWFCRFQQDVMDNGPLTKRQAQAVREAVAGANGIAMTEPPKPDPFIHYAIDLTQRPHWRGRPDTAPLYQAGGGDDHVIQVVLITALGNFLDRVVVGLPSAIGRNSNLDSLIWGRT